jgi:hypothetical protein
MNKKLIVLFLLLVLFASGVCGASIIQIRRDIAANWTSANPILAQGEMGFETDTLKLKFGDGSTNWNSLAYYSPSEGFLDTTIDSNVAAYASIQVDLNTFYYGKQDTNAQFCPYIGAVNDMNIGGQGMTAWDINAYTLEANFLFGDGSGLSGITASSGWPPDTTIDTNTTAFDSVQVDLNTFYYGKQDINAQFCPYIGAVTDLNLGSNAIKVFGDSNFNELQANFFYGDGAGLTGVTATSGWPPDTTCDTNAGGCSNYYLKTDINAEWYGRIDVNAQFSPYIGAVNDTNTGGQGITTWDINVFTIEANYFFGDGGGLTNVSVSSGWPPDTTCDTNAGGCSNYYLKTDINAHWYGKIDINATKLFGRYKLSKFGSRLLLWKWCRFDKCVCFKRMATRHYN